MSLAGRHRALHKQLEILVTPDKDRTCTPLLEPGVAQGSLPRECHLTRNTPGT